MRYLFILLFPFCLFGQDHAIDSLKQALKSSEHDTIRCRILFQLSESASDEEWPGFNQDLLQLSLKKLKTAKIPRTEYKTYLTYYAKALQNIGYLFQINGISDSAVIYFNRSLKIKEELRDKEGTVEALLNLGRTHQLVGQPEMAVASYTKALQLCKEIRDSALTARTLNFLGLIYKGYGDYGTAYKYYEECLNFLKGNVDLSLYATVLSNLAVVFENQGDIPKAIAFESKSLGIKEKLGDKSGMATSLNNLAYIYQNQGDSSRALEQFMRALSIYMSINELHGVSTTLNNIGVFYETLGQLDSALVYHNKSLKIREITRDRNGHAATLNNLAMVFSKQNRKDLALEYNLKALSIQEEIKDKLGMVNSLRAIGAIFYEQKKYSLALDYMNRSMKTSQELGYPENIMNTANWLVLLYKQTGNHKAALEYAEVYYKMRDSINNIETQKATIKQQTKYQYEKEKAVIDEKHAAEIKQQEEKAAAEKKRQNIVIASVSVVLLLVAVFSVILFNRFRVTQRQKAVIEQKEAETRTQKHIIEEKHKEITDSINYAERIQRSFLATQSHLDSNLNVSSRYVPIDIGTTRTDTTHPVISSADEGGVSRNDTNYFILFQPKDVVSGDFYWSATLNNGHFALATADSTGHGVPGAIMSLLNITSLEKAIETETSPDKILNATRKIIIERLKKDGSPDGGKDGMDCSLCVYDFKNLKLYIAAAHNPVWIVRGASSRYDAHKSASTRTDTNGGVTSSADEGGVSRSDMEIIEVKADSSPVTVNVIEVKGDKMPVGKHDRQEVPFTLHEIQLQKGDVVYTLTDGFPDQFGGEKGKKFMSKNLRELLANNAHLPMQEQKAVLERTFRDWVGGLEQVDDVTIMGIRI